MFGMDRVAKNMKTIDEQNFKNSEKLADENSNN